MLLHSTKFCYKYMIIYCSIHFPTKFEDDDLLPTTFTDLSYFGLYIFFPIICVFSPFHHELE